MPSISGNVGAVASVSSVFTRNGAVVAANGDYSGVVATHLTGATAASRYVGGTASGAPVAGTFAVGDFVIDQTGKVYICTVAGTPGTWASAGGGSPLLTSGPVVVTTADILALPTPKALVAGVPGSVLLPMYAAVHYKAGATPFTPGGSLLVIGVGLLGVAGSEPYMYLPDTLLGNATDYFVAYALSGGQGSSSGDDLSLYNGADITLSSVLAQADGDGSLVIEVYYGRHVLT